MLKNETLKASIQSIMDIIVLEQIDSTNTFSREQSFSRDTLVVSTYQTAGRGRFNRSFYSPKDEGVYFSLVLHDVTLNAQLYTITMAVAVTRVLHKTRIKWLNDIQYQGKKVGGILCEGSLLGKRYEKMIVGVGLNLLNPSIPKELESIMTSYYTFCDEFDVNQIVAQIVNEFMILKDSSTILSLYEEKCETLGHTIEIDGEHFKAIGIHDDGSLIVLDYLNNRRLIRSEITHVN